MEKLGLKKPQAIMTPDITNVRSQIYNNLLNTTYYFDKTYPFINNGYPIHLNSSTDFYSEMAFVNKMAQDNLNVLSDPQN